MMTKYHLQWQQRCHSVSKPDIRSGNIESRQKSWGYQKTTTERLGYAPAIDYPKRPPDLRIEVFCEPLVHHDVWTYSCVPNSPTYCLSTVVSLASDLTERISPGSRAERSRRSICATPWDYPEILAQCQGKNVGNKVACSLLFITSGVKVAES